MPCPEKKACLKKAITTALHALRRVGHRVSIRLICIRGKNYSKLCNTNRDNTDDFAVAKEYNQIWKFMENYAKGNIYKHPSWTMLQDALNDTVKENFLMSPRKSPMQLCLDDDKALCAYSSLRNVLWTKILTFLDSIM